ncbi:STAS domain-containing protein [Streptomyces sp. DH12]|uniref:STAS domain-containing protein n=1 Tax=Streptomyces sp. DH12 TaxID=2857010 RepID=UPI001E499C88|nr:STAS domain-containing protein [Streptomyces sp. DH12]
MSDTFTVVVTHHPQSTVIAVTGEMDLTTCPRVDEACTVLPVGGKTLRLDLSGVPFMDSTGLNLLLRLRRRVRDDGSRLVLAGLQPQPRHLLHLTEAYALFETTAADNVGEPAGRR